MSDIYLVYEHGFPLLGYTAMIYTLLLPLLNDLNMKLPLHQKANFPVKHLTFINSLALVP